MKNRVAAQTARDRKKALMERLEDKIYEFELQQSRLVEENSTLRSRNQKLEAENKELRKRLGLDEMDTDSQVRIIKHPQFFKCCIISSKQ